MVPKEHFILKYLLFYEEASEAGEKARQERLEQREEKRLEGKLKRVPDEKGSASPSTGRSPAKKNRKKKKKTIAKAIKAATPAPESPSTSTAFASNRSTSFAQASEGDSSSLRLDPSDPRTRPSELEPESIALGVINEPKEEEDMSTDLRVGFKERHRKCFHKAIDMALPSAKRTCSERVQEESEREVPLVTVPQPDVVGPSSTLAAQRETGEKEAGPALRKALGSTAPVKEALDKKDTPAPTSPPSWDEMMEMLNRVS